MSEPEPDPDVAEISLSPYLAEQLADLDALRDESGDVPYDPDG